MHLKMYLISLSPNRSDTIDPEKNIIFAMSGFMNINIPPQINIEINIDMLNVFFFIIISPSYSFNLYINYTLFCRILK